MTSPTTHRRRPDGRYDTPSRLAGRALAVVLSVLFIGLLASIAFFLFTKFGSSQVQARVVDFQVLSDSALRIDIEVVKPKGSRAYCVIRSRGKSGVEVGRDVVTFDAVGTQDRVVRLQPGLTTSERAVTGEVVGCSDTPIPRPTGSP